MSLDRHEERELLRMLRWWQTHKADAKPATQQPHCHDGMIVKTPSGGIAGMSGTTVTLEDCDLYKSVDNGTDGQRSLEAVTVGGSAVTVAVGNLNTEAVTGDTYVAVGHTRCGLRYVILEPCGA